MAPSAFGFDGGKPPELERRLIAEAGGAANDGTTQPPSQSTSFVHGIEEPERELHSPQYQPPPPLQEPSSNIERFLSVHSKNRYPAMRSPTTTTGGVDVGGVEGWGYGFSGGGGPYRGANSPMTLSESVVVELLRYLVDPLYYPVLITCARGRYRSGLVVGCLRKLQRWNMVSILEEYRRFAGDRGSPENEEFIEYFYEGQVGLDLPDGREPTILYNA
ncbi:unnamed protein product [Phytomonas sp. Hart1]|nr:unnamed protein product [Phytomonas sp. Hart1]|eukprot:CCW70874.1 unnamed protein product [Phytomonas sp. isolate Hart1]